MSLVFLKIPRLPFSSRLVKKTECQQDSSDSLLNFPFQISHFNFPNWIATSSFNSFQADHSFSNWTVLSGFPFVQIFNWLSRPFRFSTQPSFFLFFFFLKWATFSGFQLIIFFLFFFIFFDHSIMRLRIQNWFKTDAKFKRIISSKALLILTLQRTNSLV